MEKSSEGVASQANLYKNRALEALASAQDALVQNHLETAVSRAYYACFYAIHSALAARGEVTSSHKQTAIKFREYFIKTGKLNKQFSDILSLLSEWRMEADYAPAPDTTSEKAKNLVKKAHLFVNTLLSVVFNEKPNS